MTARYYSEVILEKKRKTEKNASQARLEKCPSSVIYLEFGSIESQGLT